MVIGGKGVECNIAVSIRGYSTTHINVPLLRKLCGLFKVSGYRTANKNQTLALIAQHKVNKEAYARVYLKDPDEGDQATPAPRKEPGCSFRLLNVLFHDDFRDRLVRLGQSRSREELDGHVSVDEKFWEDVRTAFIEDDEDTGQLQFENELYNEYMIDPSVIVLHDWKKLKSIYMSLRSKYKVARANFQQSGTHDNEFWNFCSGQLDVLYLHEFVSANPGIDVSVAAMLPSELSLQSDEPEARSSSQPSSTPSSDRREKRSTSEQRVIAFMKAMDSSGMRTEIAKKKIEKIEASNAYRKEKILLERQKEARESQKEARDNQKHYLEQFDMLASRIRSLQREAANETMDEIKADIREQISFYRQQQDKLRNLIQ